jgi:hypothetical protein
VCKVLQARTLFDHHDPAASGVADAGAEHARRCGDLHVLGIALTQIAQIALAEDDASRAAAAATEALELQERIGYTEGTVSALHVLGHAHRAAGNVEVARDLHRRGLTLASRIGHAAAMCEAMEDLARAEADENPEVARTLLHAARIERDARNLPLRERDAEELRDLETSLSSARGDAHDRSFTSLVAELTT